MVVRAFVRLVVSIFSGVVPLLFLSGSYSPIGSYFPNLLGKESAINAMLGNVAGNQLPTGLLPFGAAGLTGFVMYGILQRVLGAVNSATYSRPNFDPSQMMRSMQTQMPWMNAGIANVTINLPGDMTKSQYMILAKYRDGLGKPKEVAKILSMDKKHVENETNILKSNGYLTNNRKLTSKALETWS